MVVETVKKQLSSNGSILFLAAVIVFILIRFIFSMPDFYFLISAVFMIYASAALFDKKGLIITITFFIWYLIYGASSFIGVQEVVNFGSPEIVTLILIFVSGGIVKGVMEHKKEGGFNSAFWNEVAFGAIAIAIFVLDIGAIEYFGLQLPEVVSQIIMYIPLWVYLGLYLMMTTEGEKSVFTKISVVLGIIYLISVLLITPIVTMSQESSLIPAAQELVEAKQQEIQKTDPWLPLKRIGTQLGCIFSEPAEVSACVQREEEQRELESACKDQKLISTTAFNDCINEEKKKKQALQVSGAVDEAIKNPTKAEIVINSDYFPKETYGQVNYPAVFVLENPRKQKIKVEFSCNFTNTLRNEDSSLGKISTGSDESESIETENEHLEAALLCQPEQELDGMYRINFKAKLIGLETTSRLRRVFIGEKDQAWKEQWLNEITKTLFPSKSDESSRAPDEFARLNFAFGSNFGPIIEGEKNILFISTIENRGKGKIIAVHEYYVDLDGMEIDQSCIHGVNPRIIFSSGKKYPLTNCFVLGLPQGLKNPEFYVNMEFEGTLKYDYEISKETSVTIKKVEEVVS